MSKTRQLLSPLLRRSHPAIKPHRTLTSSITTSSRATRPNSLRWRPHPLPSPSSHPPTRRASTSTTPPAPLPHRPAPHRNPNEPVYELTFTCKACRHRSAHTVSKQGYHKGTVLISCPGCKARHLISDHLHIFSDTKVTLEDILAREGQEVTKGTIGQDGDVEFWADDGRGKGKV